MYRQIEPIGEAIKGKSVAIVGNAQTIFDKEYGEEIDNHDFVIRFNKGFISKPKSQGTKTSLLMVACSLTQEQLSSYRAEYICNRSNRYCAGNYTISNDDRRSLKQLLGKQPSTGFMVIDFCLKFKAGHIDLYGFDWVSPTFYNPEGYVTPHDFLLEKEIIEGYEKEKKLDIHR